LTLLFEIRVKEMKNWKGIYISGVAVLALLVSSVNAAEIQPHRIVSVGGAITEIIYALGSENRIVGVDSSSLWPQQAKSFPQIGYQRALSAEGILSLSPDLILATEDAGPLATLAQLKKVGVRLTVVPNKPTIDGILDKISAVAEAIGKKSEGRILVSKTKQKMQQLQDHLAQFNVKPKVMFLFSAGRGSPMVSGSDTSANGMIIHAGGINAVNEFEGYKPLNTEAMIAARPDVILTTERSLKMLGGLVKLMTLPGMLQTPAGQLGNVFAMDGLLLLGLGPRTPQAAAELGKLLHPSLELKGLFGE
jgi:iron complex transport system substrate-binding protein